MAKLPYLVTSHYGISICEEYGSDIEGQFMSDNFMRKTGSRQKSDVQKADRYFADRHLAERTLRRSVPRSGKLSIYYIN